MRIEQYFLMTDYSFWEVILISDSLSPTRVIKGVVQLVAPTTAEQKLARKNELKARGTLLMALPDKHQLKFNIHKDAKTLMEAIEERFSENKETKKVQKTLLKQQYENFTGSSSESLDQIHDRLLPTERRTHTLIWRNKTYLEEQSLDNLFNILKIYEAEVKSSSSASTSIQNIAFVSSNNIDSTNEPISAVASVFAVSVKIHVSALPNVDTLSNVVIYSFFASQSNSPQLDNNDLKKIDADDLEEMDLKWWSATITIGKDTLLESVGHLKTQEGMLHYGWSFQAEEEPTNYAFMAFTSLSSSSSDNKSDKSLPPSPIYDRYQSEDGYHVVPPPYTGTFMPPKPDLVFHNAPNVDETVHTTFNVKLSPTKPEKDLSPTPRPSAPIIEDWVSDSEDDYEPELIHNAPIFVPPNEQVKTSRPYVKPVETSIPAANPKTAIPKPKIHGKSKNRKGCFMLLTKSKLVPITAARPVTTDAQKTHVTRPRQAKIIVTKPLYHLEGTLTITHPPKLGNPQHALKDKGVIDSGCSRHMTENMSYLYEFEEINDGYVSFGGNPKGGKIPGKGKIRTGKLDFDDVYFVKELKLNLFSVSQMCDKNNGVLFTDTEYSLAKFNRKVNEGFLVRYSVSSKAFRVFNSRTRIVQETLHINFMENKPNVAGSGPTWLFDIDTLTKTMNYQPVTACNQSNPSAGVQEQFDAEKAGEENVQQYVLFPVWSSGFKNPQNIDRDAAFEDKEPEFERRKPESEVHVSLSSSAQTKKHDDKTKREDKGKSLVESSIRYRNLSAKFEDFTDNNINEVNAAGTSVPAVGQLFTNNTNTFSAAALEDTTYSDDEEDVGAAADFTNLETTITVSPIPTTRVHEDHPINNDDFHTCMFACFLSQEEPKRVHQALKDPSWIEAMQEKLLQFKMQKVWVLVDLPNGKRAIAYASFMGIMVYQMDVKSAFLYGTIEEEVYVCQPLVFEDPDYPDKVYKVVKALYGLHQAIRAWYETLANYLLENGFQRGKIDQTLFIKRQKGDILLVQIYVEDIIFGSTNNDLCKAFEKLMKDKFQMSSMGELTFFLGLQVKQKQDVIFISRDKYVAEILRKFGLTDGKSASTPIDTEKPLLKNPDCEDVDV
nr:hypothetical protein [Tanacetum cinerariifolium]